MWLLLAVVAALAVAADAQTEIDFARDVQPILLARCGACHTGPAPQAGLSLHIRAGILKGGTSGPAVVPGSSRDSLLIQRVTGMAAPVMPMGGEPLSDREIDTLRAWVDQGAEGAYAVEPPRPLARLAARRPELPVSTKVNPIDRFVEAYFKKRGVDFPSPVSDAVFLRRVYLDLWGLPPSPSERSELLSDPSPGKRERLLDRLLADGRHYSEHWISFWNDLLRNDEGVVYHGARQSITRWLLKALEDNLAYDDFARALLNPARSEDPAGFLMGVNWRGDVSVSQTPVMQAAQNSAQIFLGVNLKCNACHDSFISSWKLKDAYGLASFFSAEPLEIYRCDISTGEKSSPKFLFPGLPALEPGTTLEERRAAAARLFTMPENGRFARTLVNRIWKRLLGRGLVEPVDDMDAEAWDADLLDWLASDFVENRYDLKLLLRRIMTSEAYQLPAVAAASKPTGAYTFRGPLVRRLTAEQYVDSISAITGEWRVLQPSKPGVGSYAREWRLKSSPLTRALGRPIRDQVFTERNDSPATLQALELVNGDTLAATVRQGALRLEGKWKPPPANVFDSGIIRAEKIAVDVDISGARKLWLLIEDADSYDKTRVVAGWMNAEVESASGKVKLADLPTGSKFEKRPLRIKGEAVAEALVAPVPSEIVYDIAGKGFTRLRALVGVDQSSLASDISPRIRFFVFTEEPDRRQLVKVGETAPVSSKFTGPDVIAHLYQFALARDPSPEERRIAGEFERLEDLLWSLFLSPEFQYIR
jgi:hypothetical protein